ncbi:MAG TPA: YIP1 family protein, partial [Candidatus Caccomorpha excrementavium]|nr:YIP1 family protein [Candidatus Caccomorpha excrementavium]
MSQAIMGRLRRIGERLQYALYTMVHPGDGFYEIRHRGKGSVPLAFAFVILFSISFSINKRYANFIVNSYNTLETNSLLDLVAILAFFVLFCVSNWSITCLMDGEGRMRDIVTSVGYSTLPLLFALIP